MSCTYCANSKAKWYYLIIWGLSNHTGINQAAKVDIYPYPKWKISLLVHMSGGKIFTTLDMLQTYLQIPLGDKSKELVTINTHKSLFQYNRHPFGVSSAPAVFQKCMERLFQGCKGVSIYIPG